jgi:hypothetical protein
VTNKHQNQLNQLNQQHPGLHETLISVINHPLTPLEFEQAWDAMLDKYSVHDSVILEKLYDRGGCGSGLILKRYSVGQ